MAQGALPKHCHGRHTKPLSRLLLFLLLTLGMAFPRLLWAAEAVDVYVFWRMGCPHCEREIEFLKR